MSEQFMRLGFLTKNYVHALTEDWDARCGMRVAVRTAWTSFWGRADELTCATCQRIVHELMDAPASNPQTGKENAMAAKKKNASQASLPNSDCKTMLWSIEEQGGLELWTCVCRYIHKPHAWKSAVKSAAVWCDGSKWESNYEGYATSYAPKAKTDYSAEGKGDKDGKPWRKDYTKPLGLVEARRIAFHMHRNDKDKSGEAYSAHLEAVRLGVVVLGGGLEEQIAALFHDAVEDDHTTEDMLRKIGCTEHTIKIIEAVSKRFSEEQSKYRDRVIAAGPGAMRVKLADLLHNTRHDRLEALKNTPGKGQTTVDRLLKKYRPFIAALMIELKIIVDEHEQKKLATKPAGSATGSWSSNSSGTVSFAIDNLYPGDWPTGVPAPILYKVTVDPDAKDGRGAVTYMLCNGQEWTQEVKYTKSSVSAKTRSVYTKATWQVPGKVKVTGVSEEDIADYTDILESQFKTPILSGAKKDVIETAEDALEDWDTLGGKYAWDAGL